MAEILHNPLTPFIGDEMWICKFRGIVYMLDWLIADILSVSC